MSQAGAEGSLLCMYTHTAHRLQCFRITLIPEHSLLGNQSVIHHYLSSTQEAPEDSLTYTHSSNSTHVGMGRHVRTKHKHTHTRRHPGGVFAHLEVLRDHGGEVITQEEGQTLHAALSADETKRQ